MAADLNEAHVKLEHIGNEIDHWKGAVLGELQQKELLNDLVVDAMARYDEPWTDRDLARYADVLRLRGPEQIARHEEPWGKGKRTPYFAELNRHASHDFFLDPDVGVATSRVTPRYVKPCEVLGLVRNGNVVAVYQHGSRLSTEYRVAEVVRVLQRFQPNVECLAYIGEQAAILFLATRRRRLDDISACLEGPSFASSPRKFGVRRSFLTRVKLLNYKSVAICDVPLRQISFLVGPNGSGKSNFLDALRFVSEALSFSLDHALRTRGGLNLVRRQPRHRAEPFGLRMQMELENVTGWYALAVGADGEDGYEICREECHLVQRENRHEHFFHVERGQVIEASMSPAPAAAPDRLYLVTISGFKEFRPAFDALAGMRFVNPVPDRIRPIQAPGSTTALNRDGRNTASVLGGVARRSPSTKERIDEYIRGIVPSISRTGHWPKDTDETIEFWQESEDREVPFRLPASSMSDGTLRTLGILLALFQRATESEPERHLVGIEEPETALHPGAAEVLLDAIREAALHTQVLVTSHSVDLLDGISTESIIAVAADERGTRLGTLDEVSRSALRDELFTAGELLRMGQLGMATLEGQPPTMVDHLFGAES